MAGASRDSLKVRRPLEVRGRRYETFSLAAAEQAGLAGIERLPVSLKVLLENLLRHEDGRTVQLDDLRTFPQWLERRRSEREIAFRPARVLMQDFTGVPAVVDLAAMRDAMVALGGDPKRINPLVPVDLVIDHSVQVDVFGTSGAFARNVELEYQRNRERYAFLRWGQSALDGFRVVPPGTGICHQVNLEYLSQVVWSEGSAQAGDSLRAYPDTLVGTDSHTTMVNGLGVLGWGVGGIEAEAVMLGQPLSMLLPEVLGFRLTGKLREGVTATDLVLTVTQLLRKQGVVGRFVEFFGPGLAALALPDRATISNMCPEYGSTCVLFPVDRETIAYLSFTGRDPQTVALVEAYARAQGLWREQGTPDPLFTDVLELDLGTVEASLAGPRRPQDRVSLEGVAAGFASALPSLLKSGVAADAEARVAGENFSLRHGDVVIAAITSCTNTSNPDVMVAAGLLARKARARGLTRKPWVKTSLAPGSKVVADYLAASGLQEDLDAVGFQLVGFGCTTCIGNSGPLPPPVDAAVRSQNLVVGAVLSGNRNFEGRVHPQVRANYLASPPLVVGYALAGTLRKDLTREPLGEDRDGKPVYLRELWPTSTEIQSTVRSALSPEMFRRRYAHVFEGDENWARIGSASSVTFAWDPTSTYVRQPPYFAGMTREPLPVRDIRGARALAVLGDSITTDHISPAGSIATESPAELYLLEQGVAKSDFNSYGARRGNHEIMMRGTLANVRLRNELAPETEGGFTRLLPEGDVMSIYDAAMTYQERGVPLVIVAGKEYGSGSSRDWAAKGVQLLGVRAVVAESFERIHRSNLVGMGVLPLTFTAGATRKTLVLDGNETFDFVGLEAGVRPRMTLACQIRRSSGARQEIPLLCRIDTLDEVEYYRHGGILQYVLRQLLEGPRGGPAR
ncbi:MAG TPA: aconitate hydratase AcnA [Myxococcota bacterium]|nr:aconitate hydratase AcnA [Myxococcota bacterium]